MTVECLSKLVTPGQSDVHSLPLLHNTCTASQYKAHLPSAPEQPVGHGNMKLAKRFNMVNNVVCPLCSKCRPPVLNQDSDTHILLACRHPEMRSMRMNRHNVTLQRRTCHTQLLSLEAWGVSLASTFRKVYNVTGCLNGSYLTHIRGNSSDKKC